MTAFIEIHVNGTPIMVNVASINGMTPNRTDGRAMVACDGCSDPVDVDESYGAVKNMLMRTGCKIADVAIEE